MSEKWRDFFRIIFHYLLCIILCSIHIESYLFTMNNPYTFYFYSSFIKTLLNNAKRY